MNKNLRGRSISARLLGALGVVLAAGGLAGAANAAHRASAPVNSTPPTVSGTPQQGQTLAAQSGSWSGSNPIVFAFQWRRCDPAGAGCTAIAGASAQTYKLTGADVGATIRVNVSATNSAGASNASSFPSAVVSAANAPVNSSLPTISGTSREGQTLSAANGSWGGTPPITYSYQWLRCDSSGGGCSPVSGATAPSYLLSSSDVTQTLRVSVTASNGAGTAAALSDPSAIVAAPGVAPASSVAPSISGLPNQGSTLSLSQGSWNGSTPISYSYAWARCDANGQNCTAIGAATAQTYALTRADIGQRVRGVVTASNSAGQATAFSPLSAVVGSLAPVNTSLPTISGQAKVGQTLTASNGAWAGTAPIQYFYQWARSNASGGFDPIPGATRSTYTPTQAGVGHRLFVQIKAANSYGPAWADSQPTSPIAAGPTATPPPPPPAGSAIPISKVSLPNRLILDSYSFSPSPLRSRQAVTASFHVSDSNGHSVSGALVFLERVPVDAYSRPPEQATGPDGWVHFSIYPNSGLQLSHQGQIVFFLRARKASENVLGGVSARRLVGIPLG